MHDIGRTQQEYLGETQEFQPEAFEFGGAGEFSGETYGESYGETYGETYGQTAGETLGEAFESGLQETGSFETYETLESPLNEAQEMELASEMLEVTNEQELDRFLGKLIGSIGGGLKKFAGSSLGRTLGAFLKPLAKKFLPIATGAVGTFLGGPLGGIAASQLGNLASKAFGLELEGMSSEDAQFEVARRFVRFASSAANTAAAAPSSADPRTIAQLAVSKAAQRHAPGLLRGGAPPAVTDVDTTLPGFSPAPGQPSCQCHHKRRKGVWIRRGRRILLLGV